MASETLAEGNCLGQATRDTSGYLSPYRFNRRTVGSEDVLIRITHCGICFDQDPLMGSTSHEIVGVVKEVGENADRFKVGDHVGVGTYLHSCRDCESCKDRNEVFCSDQDKAIFTINGIDLDGKPTKGGYFSFIVAHERYCYKIPEKYPPELAAPLLCAGITVYAPMKRYKMNQPGKSLGIIGLGGLGHMAVKFGKAFELNVTVFSTSISKEEEALTTLGPDRFMLSSNEQDMKVLQKLYS